MNLPLYFAIPGNLDTLTGGYGYDRRLIAEFRSQGRHVEHIALPAEFPFPAADALLHTQRILSGLPDSAIIIIDGLAFGVLDDIAVAETERLRIIALCHHPLALESGLDAPTRQRLQRSERRALYAARAVVVTSPRTREVLQEQFDVPADKITVAVPGTDKRSFAAANHATPMLLTVASLTKRKAHDVLIAALAQLKHLPWQARFVGGSEFDPAWAGHLRRLTTQHDLQNRITFVGALRDVSAEYQQADIFVLPSLYEGYGMVFAEALACGLPVIAARAGAVPDVVPASAGILVPPGDAAALAQALSEVITNPALRSRLQQGACDAAQQLPTWSDTARHVGNLVDEVSRQ